MQSAYFPTSCAPRSTLYFSAPGFNTGPLPAPRAPRPPPPPPPKAYTPEKSGFPSGVRANPFFAAVEFVAPAATGVVPATVIVAVPVIVVLFGPRIDKV